MSNKQHDMVLNMLANPNLTVGDFQQVGLTADNTELLKEDKYTVSDKIKSNPAFQDPDGKFNKDKFHQFYLQAGAYYNNLATEQTNDDLLKSTVFSKRNIFAPAQSPKKDETPSFIYMPNPDLQDRSLDRFGKLGPRLKSVDEIAQTQDVQDSKTGKSLGYSPNDMAFFDDPAKWIKQVFSDPLVLAQYTQDETDPETGLILHHKGEYKLNDNGTYYYETLGDQNVAGRQVLNNFNILTVDGSTMNHYDFMDTDDIKQKSFTGSLVKNLALVGSMALPYVGPVIAGATIATSLADIFGALGKMALGSDNVPMNTIQGWARSLNTAGTTEYAQQNTWCWENVLNTIGDMASLLYVTKAIHNYAPSLVYGPKGLKLQNVDGYFQRELEKRVSKLDNLSTENIIKGIENGEDVTSAIANTKALNNLKVSKQLSATMESYQKLGANLGTAYFVATALPGVYDQAKEAGANDIAATIYTLGYGAASAALMRTGVAKRLFPSMNIDKIRFGAITKALETADKDVIATGASDTAKKIKQNWFKRIFKMGKDAATADAMTAAKTAAMGGKKAGSIIGSSIVGGGIEMASFDLLHDLAASIYNTAAWLGGSDSRLEAFQDPLNRYAMSFLGGAVNGGLGMFGERGTLKQIQNQGTVSHETALQELAYMINNGKIDKYKAFLDKATLGNKNLSSRVLTDTKEGPIYAEGTANDNQDLDVKKSILNQIEIIEDALTATGAKVPEYLLSDILTDKDLRFQMLKNSASIGLYLQGYNSICADIAKTALDRRNLIKSQPDAKSGWTPEATEQLAQYDAKIADLAKQKQEYLDGKKNADFIQTALFEASPVLHNTFSGYIFSTWAEKQTGKNFDDIPEAELEDLRERYEVYRTTEMKNNAKENADLFVSIMHNASEAVSRQQELIKNASKEDFDFINQTLELTRNLSENLLTGDEKIKSVEDWLRKVSVFNSVGNAMHVGSELVKSSGATDDLVKDFKERIKKASDDKESDATVDSIITNYIYRAYDSILERVKNAPYISSEVKNELTKALDWNIENNNRRAAILRAQEGFNIGEEIPGYETILAPENYNAAFGTDFKTLDEVKRDADLRLSPSHTSESIEDRINNETLSEIENNVKTLENLRDEIQKKEESPIVKFLEDFKLSVSDSSLNVREAFDKINKLLDLSKSDIGLFNYGTDFAAQLSELEELLGTYRATLFGMRTDKGSMGNLWGYSKTLNEIHHKAGDKDWKDLPEMEGSNADIILRDVDTMLSKIYFAKQLNAVNSGQKLNLQTKVGQNFLYITYNKFADFVKHLNEQAPEGWKLDALNNALTEIKDRNKLSSFTGTTTRDRIFNLKEENIKEIEKDKMIMEDGIWKFFEDNKDLLNDPDKLSEIINPKYFNLYDKTNDILSDSTEKMSDASFVWTLAAKAAIKSSDFYKNLQETIKDNKASIPGQENSVYLGLASVMNGYLVKRFSEAYTRGLVREFDGLSVDERAKKLMKYGYSEEAAKVIAADKRLYRNDVLSNIYKNIILVEGIPGSGKSGGVFDMIVTMLKKLHPDSLNKVWYAHATKDSAKEAVETLGIDTDNIFDKDSLVERVSPAFKKKDKDSRYDINDFYEEDGVYKNKADVADVPKEDLPSVIFIDEVGRFDNAELEQVSKFADKYGIPVLAAGDFDQTTGNARIKIGTTDNPDLDLELRLNKLQFVRAPKLGVSLRSLNSQQTSNLNNMQAYMHNYDDVVGKGIALNLHYYETDRTFKGAKLLQPDENNESAVIKLMSLTPKDHKITYIYHNEDTKMYKLLSEKYKDRVDFFKDSDAQGLEADYTIVELPKPKGEDEQAYLRDLYTGISRARFGSYIVGKVSDLPKTGISYVQDKTTTDYAFSKESIKAYSEKRKKILGELLKDYTASEIPYVPMNGEEPTKGPASGGGGSKTGTGGKAPTKTGGLTPPVPTPTPEETFVSGIYTDKDAAERRADDLSKKYEGAFLYKEGAGSPEYQLEGAKAIEVKDPDNVVGYRVVFFPEAKDGKLTYFTEQDLLNYDVKKKNSDGDLEDVTPYEVGDKIRDTKTGEKYEITGKSGDDYTLQKVADSTEIKVGLDKIKSEYSNADGIVIKKGEEPESLTLDENLIDDILKQQILDTIVLDLSDEPLVNSDGSFNHWLHPSLAFETGIGWTEDSSGKEHMDFDGMRASHRIDGVNGLFKLYQLLAYRESKGEKLSVITDEFRKIFKRKPEDITREEVVKVLSNVYNIVLNKDSKDDILKAFRTMFDIADDSTLDVRFGIKSSANPPKDKDFALPPDNQFERYDKGKNEKLEFIKSDDVEADGIGRKNIVAVFAVNGKPILEIPIAKMNSPLTIIQETTKEGARYADLYDALQEYNKDRTGGLDKFIQEAIGICERHPNDPEYKSLRNLFRMFRFTSNGIVFIKDNDFVPGKAKTFGPAITKLKGMFQINEKNNYEADFTELERMSYDPRMVISDVMIAKGNNINGHAIPEIKPGHPFVLISFNKDIQKEDLAERYVNQINDPTAKREVGLFYVAPPTANIREFIDNKRAVGKAINEGKDTGNIPSIGNDFTAYRILKAVYDSDVVNKTNYLSKLAHNNDEWYRSLHKVMKDMKDIESKWKNSAKDGAEGHSDFVKLRDQYFNACEFRNTNHDRAMELAEKNAIRTLTLRDQLSYLRKINGVYTPNISCSPRQFLNRFLINSVYDRKPGEKESTFNKENYDLINELNTDAEYGEFQVHYSIRYSPSGGEVVGTPFIKANVGKNYKIGKEPVYIYGRIDPPIIVTDVIEEAVSRMAGWEENSGKAKQLTDPDSKSDQEWYLGNAPATKKTKVSTLASEYSNLFGDSGPLKEHKKAAEAVDFKKFSENDPDEVSKVRGILSDYNSHKGNFGTIWQVNGSNKLIAVKLPNTKSEFRFVKQEKNTATFTDGSAIEIYDLSLNTADPKKPKLIFGLQSRKKIEDIELSSSKKEAGTLTDNDLQEFRDNKNAATGARLQIKDILDLLISEPTIEALNNIRATRSASSIAKAIEFLRKKKIISENTISKIENYLGGTSSTSDSKGNLEINTELYSRSENLNAIVTNINSNKKEVDIEKLGAGGSRVKETLTIDQLKEKYKVLKDDILTGCGTSFNISI